MKSTFHFPNNNKDKLFITIILQFSQILMVKFWKLKKSNHPKWPRQEISFHQILSPFAPLLM